MPKYRDIADRVAHEIESGHFQPGERVYSTRDLCRRHNVSLMTAVRAQRLLADMGVVRRVNGGGTFANVVSGFERAAAHAAASDLRKVTLFQIGTNAITGFHRRTFSGIFERGTELGLDVACTYVERRSVSMNVVNGVKPEPHTGYIAISDSPAAHFAGGALLLSPNVRSVLIDSIISGSHSVLPDNFRGMNALVDHLLAKGYRRIFFAARFKDGLGMVNASERRLAFELRTRDASFEGQVIDTGKFSDLMTAFKSRGPRTAFMFPQDDLALRFRKILVSEGVKRLPGITGFDHFASREEGLETLTTVEADVAQSGRSAVDVLFRPMDLPEIVRVPGKLIVSQTTEM